MTAKSPSRRQRRGRSVGTAIEESRSSRESGHAAPTTLDTKGVLPDTCLWIEFFRSGRSKEAEIMDRLLRTDLVYACGPVLCELLQGIRTEREKTAVLDNIAGVEYVEMTFDTWTAAAALSRELRASGTTIPCFDILIATLCLQHNLAICTEDAHFRSIRNLKHYEALGQ